MQTDRQNARVKHATQLLQRQFEVISTDVIVLGQLGSLSCLSKRNQITAHIQMSHFTFKSSNINSTEYFSTQYKNCAREINQ
jgi:hypothetical protein